MRRAWTALVREHRLPTEVSTRLERLWIRLGCRHKTIAVGPLRFRVRRLTADEHFIRDILVDQEYTPRGYAIGPNDLVIDVGGNIGSFAVYAGRQAPAGRVVSLEPMADNYQLLIRNLARNGCSHVAARRAALVAQRGPVRVYRSQVGTGGHSIRPDLALQDQEFEEVEGITLADVMEEYQLGHCDFLKLDCEGAEFEILQQIDPEICRRVHRLVLEYHVFPGKDKHQQAGELVTRLRELGFSIDHYTDVIGTYWGSIYARRNELSELDSDTRAYNDE